jgi:peptide/nickel transport system substrate-binding protein
MSMLEESTLAVNRPVMGVFNNLVMFDQQVAQNSPQSIVPDLATGWSWNEEGTELTNAVAPRCQVARRPAVYRQ